MDSCKVVLTFEPVAKLPAVTNQLTPICQYFLGALKKNFKGTWLPRTRMSLSLCKFTRGNPVVPGALSLSLTFHAHLCSRTKRAKTKCLGRRQGT